MPEIKISDEGSEEIESFDISAESAIRKEEAKGKNQLGFKENTLKKAMKKKKKKAIKPS